MSRDLRTLVYLILPVLGACFDAHAAKKPQAPPRLDSIDVIAQIALPDPSVTHLVTAAHWRRNYLYVQHSTGTVSVFDVTKASAPKPAGTLQPSGDGSARLETVVGTVALLSDSSATTKPAPGTVKLVSFADPAHPKIVRQFTGVTCLLKDTARGLIYLTNAEGLWILQENPGVDLEQEKDYERQLLYNR